jgi:hypothetical protein
MVSRRAARGRREEGGGDAAAVQAKKGCLDFLIPPDFVVGGMLA